MAGIFKEMITKPTFHAPDTSRFPVSIDPDTIRFLLKALKTTPRQILQDELGAKVRKHEVERNVVDMDADACGDKGWEEEVGGRNGVI